MKYKGEIMSRVVLTLEDDREELTLANRGRWISIRNTNNALGGGWRIIDELIDFLIKHGYEKGMKVMRIDKELPFNNQNTKVVKFYSRDEDLIILMCKARESVANGGTLATIVRETTLTESVVYKGMHNHAFTGTYHERDNNIVHIKARELAAKTNRYSKLNRRTIENRLLLSARSVIMGRILTRYVVETILFHRVSTFKQLYSLVNGAYLKSVLNKEINKEKLAELLKMSDMCVLPIRWEMNTLVYQNLCRDEKMHQGIFDLVPSTNKGEK